MSCQWKKTKPQVMYFRFRGGSPGGSSQLCGRLTLWDVHLGLNRLVKPVLKGMSRGCCCCCCCCCCGCEKDGGLPVDIEHIIYVDKDASGSWGKLSFQKWLADFGV